MQGKDLVMRSIKFSQSSLRRNQAGGFSIYVSLIVMLVLTLITLGFVRIVGSNYREITDSQYNLQAHYAAEAGVSDARKEIIERIKTSGLIDSFTTGTSTNPDSWAEGLEAWNCSAGKNQHTDIDSANHWREGGVYKGNLFDPDNSQEPNIGYSCVDIDLRPKELVYDQIDQNRSLMLPLWPVNKDGGNVDVEEFVFSWGDADSGPNNMPDFQEFTPHKDWNALPVLRVQITAIPNNFTRTILNQNTRVFFLVPDDVSNATLTHNWPALGADGEIVHCVHTTNKDFPCQVTLTFNSTAFSPSKDKNYLYFARVQAIYKDAKFSLEGNYGGTDPVRFQNIQAVITVTGRGGPILERLRERIPLRPVYDYPEYALDSVDTICKILINDPTLGVYLKPDLLDQVRLDSRAGDDTAACSVHRP